MSDNTQTTETERLVSMAIRNPDTGCPSRSFRYFGRVDLIADGHTVIDWKTTSDPAADIQKLTIGYQAECYFLALQAAGLAVDCIEYRFIQKPGIKLCGKDATPDAYRERCIEWLRGTQGALMTHNVFLNPSRLEAAQAWLWQASKRVLECRRTGNWFCNQHACKTWGRACEYLPLCTAKSLGTDANYIIATQYEDSPPRYTDPHGLTPIAFSTAGTLGMCERRYYWREECHLKPIREDTGDALFIGSASHVGLDTLFAEGGTVDKARAAIVAWDESNVPSLGEEATRKHQQNLMQAMAIAQVAGEKWKGE